MWEHSIFDFYFTSHIFPWDNYNEAVKHILIDMDYFLQLADCISYKDQGSVSVRDIKFMWEIIFVFDGFYKLLSQEPPINILFVRV